MAQVQRMEKVNLMSKLPLSLLIVSHEFIQTNILLPPFRFRQRRRKLLPPSEKGKDLFVSTPTFWWGPMATKPRAFVLFFLDCLWCTQWFVCWVQCLSYFAVPKNNVFMPSSFCQSPTGNSDSEPGETSRSLLVSLCKLKATCPWIINQKSFLRMFVCWSCNSSGCK